MVVKSNGEELEEQFQPVYDRKSELKAFDDSKSGVKGLIDAGVTKIPHIFIEEKNQLHEISILDDVPSVSSVPIIDFEGIDGGPAQRGEIIKKVRDACEKWGFFQMVNHGIPARVMDDMIEGVRRFHEQDAEAKKRFYSRDVKRPDILIEYSEQVMRLGIALFEVLSEALGLNPNHLKDMDCAEGSFMMGHYYPACPEPDLTLGTSKHTDSGFFTVLLQDQMGGLQILHEDQWVDVRPSPGALVVNIADLLQASPYNMMVYLSFRFGYVFPRFEVIVTKLIGDSEEAHHKRPVQKHQPQSASAKRRETTVKEFRVHYHKKGLDGTSKLSHFKLCK
ncbi:hypothetical protein RHGRI_012075 [Rhododendron griersonianum]|uniref:Fe2OG dioxygenase domain-containing protein n=1 Tax=Rhododendron griersonianum TaxID=479676 RepID=A0AAV6KP95_9ERIC|nr:hypothetical protein RHGRI_012075 [Rhododendron griersonianum]